MTETGEITLLLRRMNDGDPAAEQEIFNLLFEDLRRQARRFMRKQVAHHSLQATELVHEAYLRLVGARGRDWQDRGHFLAVAAKAMRCVLVDHARYRDRKKRKVEGERVPLLGIPLPGQTGMVDILDLDEKLAELAKQDEQAARVVDLRYFGGLDMDEIARILQCSSRTVERDWKFARSWLFRALS